LELALHRRNPICVLPSLLTLFADHGQDVFISYSRRDIDFAGRDMSDLYDKIKEDVAFRRKWAERGFDGVPFKIDRWS